MFARISNGIVQEIVNPVEGFSIEQCFHADLVNKMVVCSGDVQVGWFYKPETGQFSEDGNFPDMPEFVLPEIPSEIPPEEPSA